MKCWSNMLLKIWRFEPFFSDIYNQWFLLVLECLRYWIFIDSVRKYLFLYIRVNLEYVSLIIQSLEFHYI